MTNEQIKEAYDKAYEVHGQRRKAAFNAPNAQEFMRLSEEADEEFAETNFLWDSVREPKLTPLSECDGDLMSLEDFIETVMDGGFIDYDGSGNYATETHMTDISVHPSDILAFRIMARYPKVVWYNR